MSNTIDPTSSRPTRWDLPATSPKPAGTPPPVAERPPPDLPDANASAVARAAHVAISAATPHTPFTAAPHMVLAMGLDAVGQRYAPIRQRLDAFMASAQPTFQTSEGDARVSLPFRMRVGTIRADDPSPAAQNYATVESRVRRNDATVRSAAAKVGMSSVDIDDVLVGRGTPAQVREVAQELIREGRLPPPDPQSTLGQRVRQMMVDHGLGMDCASYAQKAFLASRELSRGQTKLDPKITNENLANLGRKGFRQVPTDEARPGDLFLLRPPDPGDPGSVGHTTIVRDCCLASPQQIADYRREGAPAAFGKGDVTVFTVDSSWGSGGQAQLGGVGRRTWLHDQVSGQWAELVGNKVWLTNGPYDHTIDGVYRPKGEQ
jgi:hypothetical protein